MGNITLKPKQLYIKDKEGRDIPFTPERIYNRAMDMLDTAETLLSSNKTQESSAAYKLSAECLKQALTFGEADAVPALVYLYANGLGVKKDYKQAQLYIAIGDKLGKDICSHFMNGKNHEIYDIKEFLNATGSKSYSSELLTNAQTIAKVVKENQKQYTGHAITNENLLTAVKHFELADSSNSIKVFDSGYSKNETHYYIDKEHTILRTADDLYKDCMENLKQVKSALGEKGDLTSDKLVKSFCSNAMLSFMNGKVDAAEFLISAYNQIKEYPTYQKSQEIDGSIEILCATSNMLGGRGGIHKAYKAFEKKDAKYISSIKQKAEDLAKHIKMQDPRAEITDRMVIEANNIYHLFFRDPITKQFSSDFVVGDSYQDTAQFYPPVVASEVSDYQDDKNDHHKVEVSGEGSSCNVQQS